MNAAPQVQDNFESNHSPPNHQNQKWKLVFYQNFTKPNMFQVVWKFSLFFVVVLMWQLILKLYIILSQFFVVYILMLILISSLFVFTFKLIWFILPQFGHWIQIYVGVFFLLMLLTVRYSIEIDKWILLNIHTHTHTPTHPHNHLCLISGSCCCF